MNDYEDWMVVHDSLHPGRSFVERVKLMKDTITPAIPKISSRTSVV